MRLSEPSWVDDAGFDIAAHVVALGEPDIPMTLERFAEFTDAILGRPVSNIPGPRFPLYMLGAELSEAYPVVPLGAEHALSIGMFSYRDHMFFGVYADLETLPEAYALPRGLGAEIAALTRPPRRRRPNGRPAPALRAAASPLRPCS